MELEKSQLTCTEIESSSKYESESETSIGSTISLYISSPPTLLLLSASLINSPSFYNTMS